MDVKEAVRRAKTYVTDLLAEEGLTNLGLEEIEYDESRNVWRVTVGFSRPWNTPRSALSNLTIDPALKRAYRVVDIRDDNGEVLSLRRRETINEE
ncbi:hypothetical protein SAMN06297251_12462 [Fulvimarina manganoxydans]|uniref:PepSY domain-containing protein n=1 Tax=Fulvimarina manganoxydans TaxID=937218 RepID=A0A1W2EEB5_9HYPH|nr:hypothetical protein [Fulvimarina manganoxydans]MEE2953085.1 hypothetical protein [Pseudomonadota bacterium]SMD08100.1 hypothetical protein SAMN06297251_12462 [Fulvimarina manganoxydans]